MNILSEYLNPDYRNCLEFNHLHHFDQLWNYRANWFEEPNNRRGGWSGVGRLELSSPGQNEVGLFLKRQEGHQRLTFRHPFRGEPTFSCEFNMMCYLREHGVPAPVPVFFGERIVEKRPQAILMTEELKGYRSLEEVTDELSRQGAPSLSLKRGILRAVADTVSKLHGARIQHRSLYPKHLFVRLIATGGAEVTVIDLEKSRVKLIPAIRSVYDLATLNRHARFWSRSDRIYFLHQYFGVPRLTQWQRLLCGLIIKRSNRRK